jgi:hypothetical protein
MFESWIASFLQAALSSIAVPIEWGNCKISGAGFFKAQLVVGLATVSHFRDVHVVSHASMSSLPL